MQIIRVRAAVALLLTFSTASCGLSQSRQVLTVEEFVRRIDELNGQTVSVTGYLPECAGSECRLYPTRQDADAWAQYYKRLRKLERPFPPEPTSPDVGIGLGDDWEFDRKAEPFVGKFVVITGKVTNRCRYKGRPACTDRSTDLMPTDIRAAAPSVG